MHCLFGAGILPLAMASISGFYAEYLSQPVHRLGSFGVHHGESEQTGLKLMFQVY